MPATATMRSIAAVRPSENAAVAGVARSYKIIRFDGFVKARSGNQQQLAAGGATGQQLVRLGGFR